MQKRWVFDSLVKDSDDVTGLLAYALYKHKKSNLAKGLRNEGKSEDEIIGAMQTFHNQTITGIGQLNVYEKEALLLLDGMEKRIRESINEQISGEHKKVIATLNTEHTRELKKQKDNFIKKIKQFEVTETSICQKLLSVLQSSIGNAIGNILVVIILAGLILILAPDNLKEGIVDQVIAQPIKDALSKNELVRPQH